MGRRHVSHGLTLAPTLTAAPLEVSDVVWVIGVRSPADFNMALDGCAPDGIELEHAALALSLGESDAKSPALARGREVFVLLPASGFVGMASFGPAPELPKDKIFQPVEGPFGGSISIVVGPAPKHRVEFVKERLLAEARSGFDAEPEGVPQALDAALCGPAQEFIPKFAHARTRRAHSVSMFRNNPI